MTGAGELDQRVAIERAERVGDGGGGSAGTAWVPVATVWAKAWAVSGRERAAAQQTQEAALHRFKIRRRPGIDTAMRVRWQGRAYPIVFAPDPGPREAFMVLDCASGEAP